MKVVKVLFFILFVLFYSSTSFANKQCERPSWKLIDVPSLGCKMRYNHYLLYINNSHRFTKAKIVRKNGICKVVSGVWLVQTYTGISMVYTPKQIEVDHILPFSWIRKHLGCEKAQKYYHDNYNLELADKEYNRDKSDHTCLNEDMCQRQYRICKQMNDLHHENLPCDDL